MSPSISTHFNMPALHASFYMLNISRASGIARLFRSHGVVAASKAKFLPVGRSFLQLRLHDRSQHALPERHKGRLALTFGACTVALAM